MKDTTSRYYVPRSAKERASLEAAGVHVDTTVGPDDAIFCSVKCEAEGCADVYFRTSQGSQVRIRRVPVSQFYALSVMDMLNVQLLVALRLAHDTAIHSSSDARLQTFFEHAREMGDLICMTSIGGCIDVVAQVSNARAKRLLEALSSHPPSTQLSFTGWESWMAERRLPSAYSMLLLDPARLPSFVSDAQASALLHKRQVRATIQTLRHRREILRMAAPILREYLHEVDHVVFQPYHVTNLHDPDFYIKDSNICELFGRREIGRSHVPPRQRPSLRRAFQHWHSVPLSRPASPLDEPTRAAPLRRRATSAAPQPMPVPRLVDRPDAPRRPLWLEIAQTKGLSKDLARIQQSVGASLVSSCQATYDVCQTICVDIRRWKAQRPKLDLPSVAHPTLLRLQRSMVGEEATLAAMLLRFDADLTRT